MRIIFFLMLFAVSANSQNWENGWGGHIEDCCCNICEDFEITFDETPNGATSGPGWTSTFTQSAGCSAGYAEDRGAFFETRNGDPGILETDLIDLANCDAKTLTVIWSESGTQEPEDCINFEVSLDGATYVNAGSFCDDFGGNQTFTLPIAATVNSIQLRVLMVNCKPTSSSGQAERWRVQNISIN